MNITVEKYLQHGYAVIKKLNSSELTLVRMIIDSIGNVYEYSEIYESKFMHRLMQAYEKELKSNKKIVMNIEETLENLTIPQLRCLLPSYYQTVIERRIKELEEKENATKTNRKRNVKGKRKLD